MNVSQDLSILHLILNASAVVQFVMAILASVSFMSWYYIFNKWFTVREARTQTEQFERDFWSGGDLNSLFQSAVTFQVGAESSDTMTVNISSQLNTLVTDLSAISNSFSADQADTTGTAGVSGGTELTASGSANQMITSISTAMDDVSQIQSKLGASINRLNDTANNLTSMQDNTEVAIGNIMDTDYATEASNMTKQQVLMQTGITMLKQSNSMSSMVSSLLQ